MTRRGFLAASAAGALASPAAPIRTIEALPVSYPVTGYFRFFAKPERPAVFVKITCEDGAVGWGQSVPTHTWSYETAESVLSTIRQYLAPALIGRDPLDLAGAHQAMNRAVAPSFSTGMPLAKAGLDLALHDLSGKLAKRSLAQLWGRKPLERITLSWTVNARTLAEAEEVMEDGKRRGYRHFNIKVAPDPRFDVELAKLVRRGAPDGFLWADANGGYDTATALQVAPKLAQVGVDVLEQPVAANRLSGFRDLKRQGALPILMDEGVVSSVELVEFIRLNLLDGVAMKPARTAGLWDACRQIEILRNAGLWVLGSGLTDPDVSLAASLILYGAYGITHPAALNGPQFLTGSFLRQPFQFENGGLPVPTGPGLGVEVDEGEDPMTWIAFLAAAIFAWQEDVPGVLSLTENGATVLAYHHGAGRACCYLHPLVSPAGVVLTDDGPVDHKHHRGLFWAWPVVEMGTTRADAWTLAGVEHRLVGIVTRQASGGSARLVTRHEWMLDGKPALGEEMELAVYRARGGERRLTLAIALRASEKAVSIAGAPEQNKGYGGVSIRFAPREDTRIESSEGLVAKDENHNPHRWAQLDAQFAGGRAGVRVEADPRNPRFPNEWCLRHYGFVGANFPGVAAYRIEPGKPVILRYGIRVFDRPGAGARPSAQ